MSRSETCISGHSWGPPILSLWGQTYWISSVFSGEMGSRGLRVSLERGQTDCAALTFSCCVAILGWMWLDSEIAGMLAASSLQLIFRERSPFSFLSVRWNLCCCCFAMASFSEIEIGIERRKCFCAVLIGHFSMNCIQIEFSFSLISYFRLSSFRN